MFLFQPEAGIAIGLSTKVNSYNVEKKSKPKVGFPWTLNGDIKQYADHAVNTLYCQAFVCSLWPGKHQDLKINNDSCFLVEQLVRRTANA